MATPNTWEARRRALRQAGQMSCGYCWARGADGCPDGPCPPHAPTYPRFLGVFWVRDADAMSQARREVEAPVRFSDECFSDQPLLAVLYATGPGDLQSFWTRWYALRLPPTDDPDMKRSSVTCRQNPA